MAGGDFVFLIYRSGLTFWIQLQVLTLIGSAVGKASQDAFLRQPGILLKKIFYGLTSGKPAKHVSNCDPSSGYCGLSEPDIGVTDD